MLAKLPETVPQRVAVILETSGSGQILLEGLRPLLGKDTQIDLQGVLVVDDELQHAAAMLLAEGEMRRISILLTAAAPDEQEMLDQMISDLLPADPASILLLSEPGVQHLIAAVREEDAGMLVLGTSEELLKAESLHSLRKQLRCPVCLVRRWNGGAVDTAK